MVLNSYLLLNLGLVTYLLFSAYQGRAPNKRIFLPLVSGRAEGSGLGLALAQQVAREHGGSLGYRSRPGHTVFTLLLPVLELESEPAAESGPTAAPTDEEGAGDGE